MVLSLQDPNYHSEWFAKSGTQLAGGWKALLDGVQGDQDFIHKVFKLKRNKLSCWFYW